MFAPTLPAAYPLTRCARCTAPVGYLTEDPTTPVHLDTSGPEPVAVHLTHPPVPVVTCGYVFEDRGPHGGCSEFAPPVDHPCTTEAVSYSHEDTPFGPELVPWCTEHAFHVERLGLATTPAPLTDEVRAELLHERFEAELHTEVCARGEGCDSWCPADAVCSLWLRTR